MKEYTIKCDICKRKIDWKNEKYHTFEVPGMINIKENQVVRMEYHFCESHEHFPIISSHMSYELHLLKQFNDYLQQNRWDPGKKYD